MDDIQPSNKVMPWQHATVKKIVNRTYRVKSFFLQLNNEFPFTPGQHIDIRLTAPDGYQAQRSYSIASAPEDNETIELAMELIADGEVSPFFHEVAQIGDQIEMRGPIGGPFTWTAAKGGPLLLVGGGSGVAPLMSMLRHHVNAAPDTPALLLYSSRCHDDVIFTDELSRYENEAPGAHVVHTLTRSQPGDWNGLSGRVDRKMLRHVISRLGDPSHVYICGSNGFVETVADGLVSLHVQASRIHTERFGPTKD